MKQHINAIETKFIKEFIKEEALEKKIYEVEKLKVKQDIYLTRQHNKEKRKEIIFKKKKFSEE